MSLLQSDVYIISICHAYTTVEYFDLLDFSFLREGIIKTHRHFE